MPATLYMGGRILAAVFVAKALPFSSVTNLRLSSSFLRNNNKNRESIVAKRAFFCSCSSSTSSSTFSSSSIVSSKKEIAMADSIHISNLEQKIFNTLKSVLRHFQLNIQLRVAGGWVRDKLLGKECHDIDIALEDMLGKAFCEKVAEYLASISGVVPKFWVIQSNPNQSKHLETAKMKIYGVEIDFVNLRAESYTENSRIPVMKFGTPKEDALRRDLTINSLFYNINTSSIEDFTGKGLSDLKNGIIATPLPPKSTFLDDPLRVLRAVRFAARFGYKLQEDLKQAAADMEVKSALANKVSPERVGKEIDQMITGANPARAIQELVEMDIFWVVFRLPQELKTCVPDETERVCLHTLDAMSKLMIGFGASKFSVDQRRIGLYASLLLPLRSYRYETRKKQWIYKCSKGLTCNTHASMNLRSLHKEIPVANVILKDTLKLKAHDAEKVACQHEHAEKFQKIIGMLLDEHDNAEGANGAEEWELSKQARKAINAGLVMKNAKDLWKVDLLLESIMEPSITTEIQDQQIKERVDKCLAVEKILMDLGLDNVWNWEPLLDGTTIMSELGLREGGPEIKQWQERIFKWQVCHVSGTTDDCLEWFRGQCREKHQRCG